MTFKRPSSKAAVSRFGVMVALTTTASLIASSTAVGQQELAAAPSPDRHDVEISSPTSDAPVEADGGESFDVGFSTDVPWRYSLEVREAEASGDWVLLDGDDANGRAARGENTVEVQVPEDLDPGQYDLRRSAERRVGAEGRGGGEGWQWGAHAGRPGRGRGAQRARRRLRAE